LGTLFTIVDVAPTQELRQAAGFINQEVDELRCVGLAWVAFHRGQYYSVYFAGEAKTLPAFSRGAVLDLADEISKLKQKKR